MKLLFQIYRKLLASSSVEISVLFGNFYAHAKRQQHQFTLLEGKLIIREAGSIHSVFPNARAIVNFSRGIRGRGAQLAEQYFLDRVHGKLNVVIDVGANSGDFLLAIGDDCHHYIGLEPIIEDYEFLSINCSQRGAGFLASNVALGDTRGKSEIFVSRGEADSSLIEPASGYTEKREVQMETLDSVITSQNLISVDLVKIEAEGYEPEVIRGGNAGLRIARYIAVDGGPERGPDSSSTIEECTNLLTEIGFELVSINLDSRPGVALYKNTLLRES